MVAALLALAAAPAVMAAAQTQVMGGPLDGTKWNVKVTPDEAAMKKGEKVFDDVLVFDGGYVSMSECLKYGFKASKYTADKSGDGWSFQTEQMSKKQGKSIWTADVMGDAVKGKMVWTKADGTVLGYMFEGRKAVK
jgi:hypothetical protein